MKRLLVLVLLAGCPHQHPGGDGAGQAVVIFHADVPDAVLWVDGRYIGPVGALRGGVAVRPGLHRFELRDDHHFSHFAELDLHADDKKVVEVHLAPILP